MKRENRHLRFFSSGFQKLEDRAAVLLEALKVPGIVVGRASLPHAENDADPLERQGPHRGVVFLAPVAEQLIVRLRPLVPSAGLLGELVKRLAKELGTSISPMYAIRLAATFRHGCDARVGLQLAGGL